jgi:hypothetical protein
MDCIAVKGCYEGLDRQLIVMKRQLQTSHGLVIACQPLLGGCAVVERVIT